MLTQSQVNPLPGVSLPDGGLSNLLSGKLGDLLVSELHGKYFNQSYRGNTYWASNAAAGAVYSIFSATTAPIWVGLALWNPPQSGKIVSVIRSIVGLQAQGATAIACFGYCWLNNVQSLQGTAAPITITSQVLITATRGSCVIGPSGGNQGNSVVTVVNSATISTAMTWGRASSMSLLTGAATTQVGIVLGEDLDGTLLIPPGTFMAFTTNVLSGVTATGTLIWEEIPI